MADGWLAVSLVLCCGAVWCGVVWYGLVWSGAEADAETAA